jgi:hypothetical protein
MAKDYPWNDHAKEKEYYASVGYLTQQWNILEMLYCHRASDIMGLKRADHDLIFRHLGTVSIGTFMNEYAERHIKSAAARDQLAHVTNFVNLCRINRNAIVHGWVREYGDLSHIKISSRADQRRRNKTEFSISIEDIARVCDDIQMAGRLTLAMSFLIHKKGVSKAMQKLIGADWQTRLHAKPLLPKLVAASPQKHQKRAVPPRSSRK